MSNIDITKTYQTRSGLPVRIYAVDGCGVYHVHGAIRSFAGWEDQKWSDTGRYDMARAEEGGYDLIPAKQWRAWKYEEGPKRLMINWKNRAADTCDIAVRSQLYSDAYLFENAQWFHEDGTTTPCGVCES